MPQDDILAVQRLHTNAFITLLVRGAILLGVVAWIALIYTASIGYRDARLGQVILAGSFGLGLATLIFARPQFGAYILVITTYTYISTILTRRGAPSVYKLLLALILVALFAYYLIRRRTAVPLPGRFEWLILGYLAVQMISSFFARDRAAAQVVIEDQAKDLIVVYSIIYSLYRPSFLKQAIWFVALTITLLALLGVYQVLAGNYHQTFFDLARTSVQAVVDETTEHRLGGPLGRPNFWGQMLAAAVPIVIYLFVLEKRLLLKSLLIGALFSIIFAVFYTYSRGAVIALLVTQLLILIERKVRFDAVLMATTIILVSVQLLSPTQIERFSSILVLAESEDASIKQDSSFRGRTAEMRAGLLMFGDSPFVGVGIGNYEVNYLDYASRVGLETRNQRREPHSLYVEILAETGLLGATFFTILFLSLFAGLRRIRQQLKVSARREAYLLVTGLQMSIISYLVSSLFLHGAYIRQLWGFVALAIAAIYLFEQALKSEASTGSSAGI